MVPIFSVKKPACIFFCCCCRRCHVLEIFSKFKKEDKQTTGISATGSGLKLLQENIGIISTITWENESLM